MNRRANTFQDISLYFDWKNKVDRNAFLGKLAGSGGVFFLQIDIASFLEEARSDTRPARRESVANLSRRLSIFQRQRKDSAWSSKYDEDGFEKVLYQVPKSRMKEITEKVYDVNRVAEDLEQIRYGKSFPCQYDNF